MVLTPGRPATDRRLLQKFADCVCTDPDSWFACRAIAAVRQGYCTVLLRVESLLTAAYQLRCSRRLSFRWWSLWWFPASFR